MLRFVGDGDQKKFTQNPRHFSMQNSQASTKKIFTKFFWRAGKVKLRCAQSSRPESGLVAHAGRHNPSIFLAVCSLLLSGLCHSTYVCFLTLLGMFETFRFFHTAVNFGEKKRGTPPPTPSHLHGTIVFLPVVSCSSPQFGHIRHRFIC